jgi:hypothetical protein
MIEAVLIADADKSLAEDELWPVYRNIFGANARLGGRVHGTDGPLRGAGSAERCLALVLLGWGSCGRAINTRSR